MREQELLHVATLGACTCAALAFEAVIGLILVLALSCPQTWRAGVHWKRRHRCTAVSAGRPSCTARPTWPSWHRCCLLRAFH
jgi:hypothetical protein